MAKRAPQEIAARPMGFQVKATTEEAWWSSAHIRQVQKRRPFKGKAFVKVEKGTDSPSHTKLELL